MESNFPIGETVWLFVTRLRNLFNPNLYSLNLEQSYTWWCKIHRDRPWLRNDEDLLQHLILQVCWTEYIPGHADVDFAALCHLDALVTLPDLFLDIHPLTLHRPLLVQPPSIRFL
jgi:hypothetical protein